MTEDLIAMAKPGTLGEMLRDSGLFAYTSESDLSHMYCVLRFAALVRADAVARTREECAKACEAGMDNSMEERMKSKSIQLNGADGELEALKFWSTVSLYNNARALCAAAIRALGERT